MVAARRASLLLTFTVAMMAIITPALSQFPGIGLPGFPLTSPLECWKIINGVEGCTEQLLKLVKELNIKFLPDCCKAIVSIPITCAKWIFPRGLSFGDQVNKYCNDLLAAVPLPAS